MVQAILSLLAACVVAAVLGGAAVALLLVGLWPLALVAGAFALAVALSPLLLVPTLVRGAFAAARDGRQVVGS